MKKTILAGAFFLAVFSLNAQKSSTELQTLVDRVSEVNCKTMPEKAQKEKVTKLLKDFIVANPDAIQDIRTREAINQKPISKDNMEEYLRLQKQAYELVRPDAKKPARTRGAGPSDAAWASYWDWYKRDRERLDRVPGYVVVDADFLNQYHRDTRCTDAATCMTDTWLWTSRAVQDLDQASGTPSDQPSDTATPDADERNRN